MDGLSDLVFQASAGPPNLLISIAESPDSLSYPTQEVWRDTVGPPLVLPIGVYDIDQDGKPEIVKNRATPYGYLGIFESVGNNIYDLIFADDPDTLGYEAPAATFAFGDFDGDTHNEFVPAGGDEWYWIYESPADNTYEKISEGQLLTANIRDCFSVPDADSDGKLEFVVKGYTPMNGRVQAFIFEATGDNTYQIVKSHDLGGITTFDYYGGYSDAGDVDGDTIPEIVLESATCVYLIKSAGNDSFYIWDTLPGNFSGSNVRVTNDIDQNGLNEIVISGNNETRIYEYVPGEIEENDLRSTPYALRLKVYPNPFRDKVSIVFSARNKGVKTHTAQALFPCIKIYDATGRLVRQWGQETMRLSNQILWDGTDDSNALLSPGIYFVRLETANTSVTKKIIKLE